MIILSEVAQKLEAILNGLDTETSALLNPTEFNFQVETEGFHIDHIKKEDNSGNFIPVFISSLGGQFNPVKGLKQGTYSIQINFYFPVRFKNDFYALGDFLIDTFVGATLNYGPISKKAISNISWPQFGEIQNLDLKEFKKWTNSVYQKEIDIMEPYLSMSVVLYLSNAADGLIYGNDFKVSLYLYDGVSESPHVLDDVDIDGASIQSNSQAQSEQEEGATVPESVSFPFGTSYGTSFKIYPNLNTKAYGEDNYYFYRELLKKWFAGKIQDVTLIVNFWIPTDDENIVFSRKCFVSSVMAPIEKGQLFSLTLTLAKSGEIEAGD